MFANYKRVGLCPTRNEDKSVSSTQSLQDLPKLFIDKMIKEWMFENVKVVSQLSNVVKWNKESDEKESMLIAIEKGEI